MSSSAAPTMDQYPLGGLSTGPGKSAFVVTIISMVLVTICVGLRVWLSIINPRPFGFMGYFYYAGYIVAMAYSAQFLWGICPNAIGMHIMTAMTLYPDRVVNALKIVLASEFIWAIATTLVKFSILSLYLEIFRGKLFRASCYTIGALSLALAAAMFLIAGLLCQPIEKNWDPLMTTGHCGDSVKMDVATATINMILDLFIVILPLPSLWKLQMSWTRKAMLSGIFSLGLVICAMNLTRIVFAVTLDMTDATHAIARIGLFSILEVNVGMICASLPTLGPLIFGDHRGGSSGGRKGTPDPRSSAAIMNTFVRRRAAGLGRSDGGSGRFSEIATLNDNTVFDEEALPLHQVEKSGKVCEMEDHHDAMMAPSPSPDQTLPRRPETARLSCPDGQGKDINIRTDIYVR
ncbi:hypothetical protein AnigIFM63604_001995 [Aspergillus niger]|uniref:Rhodopsin domain-containing protein n=2 Tax=Aspergillus TaxID=5052 RepID=A0A9W6EGD9_ASPNG|nr:hypothetical protein AnigIFM63604_001995 [Aspergillus niger]